MTTASPSTWRRSLPPARMAPTPRAPPSASSSPSRTAPATGCTPRVHFRRIMRSSLAQRGGHPVLPAFFDPSATYYRRKHRERMLMTQIIGPAQNIQPIRSIVELGRVPRPQQDVQTPGTLERDGVFSQLQTFPPANDLFGGASSPRLGRARSATRGRYQLPANALPGTYLVTVKGRRTYLGEDIPFSRTIEIQVGTRSAPRPPLTTGPCNSCHSQGRRAGQRAARQRQPRRLQRLPRAAGLRAGGPHLRARALHPLALGPRTTPTWRSAAPAT